MTLPSPEEIESAIEVLEGLFKDMSTNRMVKVDGVAYKKRNAIGTATSILSALKSGELVKPCDCHIIQDSAVRRVEEQQKTIASLEAKISKMVEPASEAEIYAIVDAWTFELFIRKLQKTETTDDSYKYPDDKISQLAKALIDKVGELVGKELQYAGGEDDGYGGKTRPITWKEAYEEELQYDKDMRKELMTAMAEIRASKGYPQNQYPSPCDRAWKAAGTRIIKDLENQLQQGKEEVGKGEQYWHDRCKEQQAEVGRLTLIEREAKSYIADLKKQLQSKYMSVEEAEQAIASNVPIEFIQVIEPFKRAEVYKKLAQALTRLPKGE